MAGRLLNKLWVKCLLGGMLWTLIGLAFAGQLYLSRANIGAPVPWRFAVARALADWYVFAVLSVPVLRLAARCRLDRASWHWTAGLHLAASVVFSLSWMLLRAAIGQWEQPLGPGGDPVPFAAAFTHALVATFFFNVLIYWAIVSIWHAVEYYRRYQEREFCAAELEKSLAQARLQALQMQLNPHFLFNTLHAISALMHKDVDAADRMLSRLSELLRYALESTDAHEVSLQQELAFLERYLEIEQTRFGERLQVRFAVDPEALEARVPNLILQPLVENAIRHGIEPHAKPGAIEITARQQGSLLHLEVRDNGAGLASPEGFAEGVGLKNTRARLQQLYRGAGRLEFSNAPGGGLVVHVVIPWRHAAEIRSPVPIVDRRRTPEAAPEAMVPPGLAPCLKENSQL